jgi:hypothetical protein
MDGSNASPDTVGIPGPFPARGRILGSTARIVDRAGRHKTQSKHMANQQRILAGLTAAEQRQLASLLRKLRLVLTVFPVFSCRGGRCGPAVTERFSRCCPQPGYRSGYDQG